MSWDTVIDSTGKIIGRVFAQDGGSLKLNLPTGCKCVTVDTPQPVPATPPTPQPPPSSVATVNSSTGVKVA